MTVKQTEEFIRMIKSFFPYFSITDDVIRNWPVKLKDYDYNEVLEQFDNYVNDGDKEPPTLSILIHPLRTFEQKKLDEADCYYYCSKCNKKYLSMEEADDCFERDLDISYIKRISKKLGINPTEFFGDLRTVTLETINKNYTSFIKKVVLVEKEKNVLNNFEKQGINGYWKHVIMENGNENKHWFNTI